VEPHKRAINSTINSNPNSPTRCEMQSTDHTLVGAKIFDVRHKMFCEEAVIRTGAAPNRRPTRAANTRESAGAA
jgi:hypothetical protein